MGAIPAVPWVELVAEVEDPRGARAQLHPRVNIMVKVAP